MRAFGRPVGPGSRKRRLMCSATTRSSPGKGGTKKGHEAHGLKGQCKERGSHGSTDHDCNQLRPSAYEKAIASTDREQCLEAIREQCGSIIQNNPSSAPKLELTALGSIPIGSKWEFKKKRNPDGAMRYKARLVIKGFKQDDWEETCTSRQAGFTPTPA